MLMPRGARLRDFMFERAFSGLFMYNILFEDAEQDERYLELGPDSSVLSITGAGCGVAGIMSRGPRRLDAADINEHHLALAGAKIAASRGVRDYETFYDLMGRGFHPDAQSLMHSLYAWMPDWMQRYWHRHWKRFARSSLYSEGLTSRMLSWLRRLAGIDATWLTSLLHAPVAERIQAIDDTITPVLERPEIRVFLKSPMQLLALGVNFTQRDRMLEAEDEESIATFIINHLKRVAATELETNWFVWHALTGRFNHAHPEAVPPYLRRDRHEGSLHSPTEVQFHHRNIFRILGDAGPRTWSHYTLCDAPDWMSEPVERRLLDEIWRTSREGAVVLYRSVEPDSFIQRIDEGRRFEHLEDISKAATLADRTRQYRRVDFFRVRR